MDEPLWLEIPASTAARPSEDRRPIHAFVVVLWASVVAAGLGGCVGGGHRSCPSCSLLQVSDQPLQVATVNSVATTTILSHEYGSRFTYLLATNDDFIDAARTAMVDEGRSPQEPPFLISVGGGDETEFSRIGANDYQKAAIAEPLNLEGWQLIDELNRARAGQPQSGYVAPPYLITSADVPTGASFDPPSGYRNNYLQIWGR
jgi:ribose transport system substrate-binding protein